MKDKNQDTKRLVGYAFMFKSNLFLGIFFLIISATFELLAPFSIKKILDNEVIKEILDFHIIIKLIAIYLLFTFFASLFEFLSTLQLKIMSMKIVQKMRMQIYQNIQNIEISFFDNMPSGSIVSKITNDTEAVQGLYVKVLGGFVKYTAYIAGIYIILFTIQVNFALLSFLILPWLYLIVSVYNKKAKKYNNVIRQKISQINASLNEIVQGISIIQAFNNQKSIYDEFEAINKGKLNSRKKLLTLNSLTSHNIVSTSKQIVFTLLIYYFGVRVLKYNDIASVGLLYIYVDYIGKLFHYIQGILDQISEMSKSTVASTHVFEMIDKKIDDKEYEDIGNIEGNVEFKDVSFYYKDDEYVLKNINISAKKGQTIALVGHTGSGKSSITNLLLKFYSPQKGEIYIDNKKLSELSDKSIRKNTAIVLQEPYLFAGTILSNITLNKKEISRQDAINALNMVGADIVLQNLENGIDEKVVERGATLSSGQRQLISFARALAHNPKILILDEATSSVDTQTETIIQNAMELLMKGRTTFIIAHRLSTIKNADKIYLLDKGNIIEEGNHDYLISKKGKYYDMYMSQNNDI